LKLGAAFEDHGLVFTNEIGGRPMCWRNPDERDLKPLLTVAEIPVEGISLYALRHTAASVPG
jgi:formylglycine-generating enzyme required for sulfatase activity